MAVPGLLLSFPFIRVLSLFMIMHCINYSIRGKSGIKKDTKAEEGLKESNSRNEIFQEKERHSAIRKQDAEIRQRSVSCEVNVPPVKFRKRRVSYFAD